MQINRFFPLIFAVGAVGVILAAGGGYWLAVKGHGLGSLGWVALAGGLAGLPAAWLGRLHHRRLLQRAETEREVQVKAAMGRQVEDIFAVFHAIAGGIYVADMETHEILAIAGRDRDCFQGALLGGKGIPGPGPGSPGPCLFCTDQILLGPDGKPGPPVVREFRNPWNDNWYLGIARALDWFDGRLVRLEIAINITERKRVEAALRHSERNFRELVENSLVGIMLIQDGKIIYQNPEQQRLLGRYPRHVRLENFAAVHPDDQAKVRESYRRISKGHSRQEDLDFRFYTGGRQDEAALVWVYGRARLIDFQGRKTLLISMMDMTRAKELEGLVRIQDKMSSLGRVAAGLAHEIRNPLSGFNIYLATLHRIYQRPEQRDQAEEIFRRLAQASTKIEAVIKRVVDFAQPGQPLMDLIPINEPVLAALDLAAVFLKKHGVELDRDLAPGLPPCRIDGNQIEQVILNLLSNSAEAMGILPSAAPRLLRVRTLGRPNEVEIQVDDSGPGLAPEVRGKIFDPFFTTKLEGTGIGLNISQRIIKDHGGRLEAGPSDLGGAGFRVILPIAGLGPAGQVKKMTRAD